MSPSHDTRNIICKTTKVLQMNDVMIFRPNSFISDLEFDIVDTYYPRKDLVGDGKVYIVGFILGIGSRFLRIVLRDTRMSQTADLGYSEFVYIVADNGKFHRVHSAGFQVVVMTVNSEGRVYFQKKGEKYKILKLGVNGEW